MTRRRTAVLALVLLAALTGCADDGGDPDSAPPETVTETVTPSATPTTAPTPTPTPSSSPTATASSAPTESVSPPPVDLSQPPTTYAEAAAHIAAARGTAGEQQLDRFQSGDEQFYCSFGERFIRPSCEILAGISDPATCGDSMATKVGRIELTKRGWRPFCNTDTIRQPGATVLAEGGVAVWSEDGVGCVLEGIGLTCVEMSGQRGFFLAPGQYQVF